MISTAVSNWAQAVKTSSASKLDGARPRPTTLRPVPEDVHLWVGHGADHAAGHLISWHRQLGVHRRDDHVEAAQQVIAQIQLTVDEDVDLHAGEDPEWRQLLVQSFYLDQLLGEPLGRQPMGDRQAGRMIGDDEVLVAQCHGGARHRLDRCAAV